MQRLSSPIAENTIARYDDAEAGASFLPWVLDESTDTDSWQEYTRRQTTGGGWECDDIHRDESYVSIVSKKDSISTIIFSYLRRPYDRTVETPFRRKIRITPALSSSKTAP